MQRAGRRAAVLSLGPSQAQKECGGLAPWEPWEEVHLSDTMERPRKVGDSAAAPRDNGLQWEVEGGRIGEYCQRWRYLRDRVPVLEYRVEGRVVDPGAWGREGQPGVQ